jgi:hypothetical protein
VKKKRINLTSPGSVQTYKAVPRDWKLFWLGLVLGGVVGVVFPELLQWYQRPRLRLEYSARSIERSSATDPTGKRLAVYALHDGIRNCHEVVAFYELASGVTEAPPTTIQDLMIVVTNPGRRTLEGLRLTVKGPSLDSATLVQTPNLAANLARLYGGPDSIPVWAIDAPSLRHGETGLVVIRRNHDPSGPKQADLEMLAPKGNNLEGSDVSVEKVPVSRAEAVERTSFSAEQMAAMNFRMKVGQAMPMATWVPGDTNVYSGTPMCPKGTIPPSLRMIFSVEK